MMLKQLAKLTIKPKSTFLSFSFCTRKKAVHKFEYAVHTLSNPSTSSQQEDAHFVSDNVLVVADGGQTGDYAKKLCDIIGRKIGENLIGGVTNPPELLSSAVNENTLVGSTTVSMLCLHPNGLLWPYYLGNSSYGVFDSKIFKVFYHPLKDIDTPYRVGPQSSPSYTNQYDSPYDGQLQQFGSSFYGNRTIVLATDGVWHNYHPEEMQKLIAQHEGDLAHIAKTIAEGSMRNAGMQEYQSPYYKLAVDNQIQVPKKGILGDVTVVVAKIVKQGQ